MDECKTPRRPLLARADIYTGLHCTYFLKFSLISPLGNRRIRRVYFLNPDGSMLFGANHLRGVPSTREKASDFPAISLSQSGSDEAELFLQLPSPSNSSGLLSLSLARSLTRAVP